MINISQSVGHIFSLRPGCLWAGAESGRDCRPLLQSVSRNVRCQRIDSVTTRACFCLPRFCSGLDFTAEVGRIPIKVHFLGQKAEPRSCGWILSARLASYLYCAKTKKQLNANPENPASISEPNRTAPPLTLYTLNPKPEKCSFEPNSPAF